MNWPWETWHDESWLDVFAYQSGHSDNADFASWIHHGAPAQYAQRREGRKRPVMNLEPPYEAHYSYASGKSLDDYVVRRAMYWSLLSTPIAGITYGGHGVWSWHTKPGEPPTDHPKTGVAPVWREALDLPGAKQMSHLRKLMDSVPWHELVPRPDLLQQSEADALTFSVAVATPNQKTIVAYFPKGAKAQWSSSVAEGKMIRWMNPATGAWKEAISQPPNDANDWIAVIETKP
jgi:hypothetical protein